MNPGLLNIWRENGANLRFGETKNLVVFGVTAALFVEFFNRAQQSGLPKWSYAALAEMMARDVFHALIIALLGLSMVISVISVFPNISGRYWRLRLILGFCRRVGLVRALAERTKTSYFMDIAAFRGGDDYAAALLENGATREPWSGAERDLITQIWIVSRIAASKFVLFSASIVLTLLAVALILAKGAV